MRWMKWNEIYFVSFKNINWCTDTFFWHESHCMKIYYIKYFLIKDFDDLIVISRSVFVSKSIYENVETNFGWVWCDKCDILVFLAFGLLLLHVLGCLQRYLVVLHFHPAAVIIELICLNCDTYSSLTLVK